MDKKHSKQEKSLSEMSLAELWQLFPIVLTPHNPHWSVWYREEIALLQEVLPSDMQYHHIGSTAIKDIMAKPIIDILIVVNSTAQMQQVAQCLCEHEYLIMSSAKDRISMNKGYTQSGYAEKVFHLHIRVAGDTDEIFFRDYLNAHPDIAKEYEQLKLRLWKKYEHNRDAYTEAKSEFIKEYTALAKQSLHQEI